MARKKTTLTFDSRIEYAVILPAFLLMVIGLIALFIATSHDHPDRVTNVILQQGTWILVGTVAAFVVMHFDSRLLWRMTPVFYGLGLVLMIAPLVSYDPNLYASTGAKNWFYFGGSNLFQPSELMKIAYILKLAQTVVNFQGKKSSRSLKDDLLLITYLALWTVPIVLLLGLQNDFGTLLVFVAIFSGIVLVSGVSWKIILPVILALGVIGGGMIALALNDTGRDLLTKIGFSAYQLNRIDAWIHPFASSQTHTYQQSQSLISVGIGGLFGHGFNVVALPIPVRESDMIFTVIAENGGFVGSAFVILLYFLLIYRMIRVTYQANNQFYIYISTGITMMILFHVFENIGATIGVLPLTGIPLPFISQGGSSLMGNLIGLGLVLSMKYNQLPDFSVIKKTPLSQKTGPIKRISPIDKKQAVSFSRRSKK